MPYSFLYKDQHQAQAVALFCMDFRFKEATLEFLKRELDLVDLDVVALAGASKNVAAPSVSSDFETATRQIELSSKLHEVKKIVLVDHVDCGAYGGSTAFETKDEERDAHVASLRKAKKILEEKFKDKEIILYYAKLKNKEIQFEKV